MNPQPRAIGFSALRLCRSTYQYATAQLGDKMHRPDSNTGNRAAEALDFTATQVVPFRTGRLSAPGKSTNQNTRERLIKGCKTKSLGVL